MYQKINRNSFGQQMRRRERLVHQSSVIIPAKEGEKDGGVTIIPAKAVTTGIKPRLNPIRQAKKKAARA